MRADQNDSLQADNLKLKEFIKKQTVSIFVIPGWTWRSET